MGKHTALLLRASLGSTRSMTGLPRGSRTLHVPVTAGAATTRSRRRRGLFPFRRARRSRLAGCSGRTSRTTSDGLGPIAQERETQPRVLGKWSQRWSPSFNPSEVPHSAVSLFLLPVKTHGSSLFHLLDALITHGLVVENSSAHLSQPSVDGRWQRRVTWPAVGVILQIRGSNVRSTDLE